MTIKQQGGVFGRNPLFNDVEANTVETTSLTVSSLTAARVPFAGSGGTLTDDDDLSFDGNVLTVKGSATQQINVRSRAGGFGQAGGINIYGNSTDTTGLLISKSGSGSGAPVARADIINQANSDFRLGSNDTPHMTIKGGGDVQLLTGNLVISTSGKGIDFSATSGTGTSELFDDYEEGTWTPVIIGRSSAGTGTYTTQRGMYTKVGDTVFFYAILNWSAHTGTGNMAISGLPFTTFSTIGHNPTMAVMGDNLTFSGQLAAIIDRNATTITIRTFASGGAATDLAIDTAGGIYVSGFYKAA